MLSVTPHRCSSSRLPTSLAGEQIPGSPKVKASICVWSQPGPSVVIRPAGDTDPREPRGATPALLPWPCPASELHLPWAQCQPWVLSPGSPSFKTSPVRTVGSAVLALRLLPRIPVSQGVRAQMSHTGLCRGPGVGTSVQLH